MMHDETDARSVAPPQESDLVRNSSWGIVSHVAQAVFLSLFFILLARHYSTDEFAKYIIATVLAQIISAFSSLGLGHWFIREIVGTQDRVGLTRRFLKAQIYFGICFYLVNIGVAFAIYDDRLIRLLAILCGTHVVFDNLTNALKSLNIADLQQRRTFAILTIESFLRLAVACILLVFPLSLITMSCALIVVRVATLNLFLRLGSSSTKLDLRDVFRCPLSFLEIKTLLLSNWPWIILGGVSVINWRSAAIIISTNLSLTDVAIYEITYKLFSIAQIVPVIVATSVFPLLVRLAVEPDDGRLRTFYRQMHAYHVLFGLISYTFAYSFADICIRVAFGSGYATASGYAEQMFLTMLVFPTAFLQGNVLLALRLERRDMLFNVVLLTANVAFAIIGLHFYKSLTVVTGALFVSFLLFHLLQDIFFIRQGISSTRQVAGFYATTMTAVSAYVLLARAVNRPALFVAFWCVTIVCFVCGRYYSRIRATALNGPLTSSSLAPPSRTGL